MFDFSNLDTINIIAQVIGIIATVITILSFQPKKRGMILILQTTSGALWGIHFALLQRYGGMALQIVSVIRGIAFFFKPKSKFLNSPITMVAIMVLFIVAGIITFEGPISLCPMIAMIASTLALFQTKENRIRVLYLISSPLWLFYDAMVGSIGGVITEIFTIVSIIIALIRFRDKGKQEEPTIEQDT